MDRSFIRLNIQPVWTGVCGVLVWKKTALIFFLAYVSQTSDCGLYFLSSLAKNNEENWLSNMHADDSGRLYESMSVVSEVCSLRILPTFWRETPVSDQRVVSSYVTFTAGLKYVGLSNTRSPPSWKFLCEGTWIRIYFPQNEGCKRIFE